MLTLAGLQKYYDYLASQKTRTRTNDKMAQRKVLDWGKREEEFSSRDETNSASSGMKQKKKGKRFLRLIESYSRHVEGLQMIQ